MEREYTFLTDLTDNIFISYSINLDIDYLIVSVKLEYNEDYNKDIITARTQYSINQIKQMLMSNLDISMFIFEKIMNEIKSRYGDLPKNKKYLKFKQRFISTLLQIHFIYIDNLKNKK